MHASGGWPRRPFSPCGRRWPCGTGSDEGSLRIVRPASISRLSSLFPLMMVFPSQLFLLSFGVGAELLGAAPLRQAVEGVDGEFDGLALVVRERGEPRGDPVAADAGHGGERRVTGAVDQESDPRLFGPP